MKFGKIGNLYAIRISGDKFIDQTGNVHYKDKEPDIRMAKSVDIPQDIRSALDSVLLAEKEYGELYEKLEEAEKAKQNAMRSLKDLSKETLCTAEEFIQEFYNNIPDNIRNKYFNIIINDGFPTNYNNRYSIESNFSTKYGPCGDSSTRAIYLKRCRLLNNDKNIMNNLMAIKSYLLIGAMPTWTAEYLGEIANLLKFARFPLPIKSSKNFEEYIAVPNNHTEYIAMYSTYSIPLTEKYLTKEYACRLAKEFFTE